MYSEDLFTCSPDEPVQQLYEDTQKFGSNTEDNYKNFLKINNNIKPAASTPINSNKKIVLENKNVKLVSKSYVNSQSSKAPCPSTSSNKPKFEYKRSQSHNIELPSYSGSSQLNSGPQPVKHSAIQSKPSQETSMDPCSILRHNNYNDESQLQPTTESNILISVSETRNIETQTTETNSHVDVVLLIKSVLREVKLLRHEVKTNKCKCTMTRDFVNDVKLNIPARTVEQFQELEKLIKEDSSKEKLFLHHLRAVSDPTHEKYVRACLKKIITDEAASSFSWNGQHENIPVKSFTILNILKEEALKKFQYAKDRRRRQ